MNEEMLTVFNKLCQIPGIEKIETNGIIHIDLPQHDDSDFTFSVSLSKSAEPMITAINYKELSTELWFHTFNIHDYDSEKERLEAFYQTIKNLLTNPTKIVQNTGLIISSYDCYYYINSNWVEVFPLLFLKPLNILNAKRSKIVYRASKIISNF
jgi:hypothetical protein